MTNLNLPSEFWAARPLLAQIRQQAWARYVSPDAVFHVFLAGFSWKIPMYAVEGPTGERILINHQPLLVGPSGSGKSAADTVARTLLRGGSQVEVLHPTHDEARKYMRGAMGDTFFYVTPFDPNLPEEPVQAIESLPLAYNEPEYDPTAQVSMISISEPLMDYLRPLALRAARGEGEDTREAQARLLRIAALLRLLDGPNWRETRYEITVEDWNLAVAVAQRSDAMRAFLEEEAVLALVDQYKDRILARLEDGPATPSHIYSGWSSMNTRTTIREVVLPALLKDGTLTFRNGRYTA